MKLPQSSSELVFTKTYWVDEDWLQTTEGAPRSTFFIVGFRRNTAGEARRLADKSGRVDKRGRPRTPMGDLIRERVMLSVGTIDGLEADDGTAITRITPEVYDRLPEWFVADVSRVAARINGLTEDGDDSDDDDDEVDGTAGE